MPGTIKKIVLGSVVAYFFARAVLFMSLPDIFIFTAIAVIPFFLIFREIYFIGFLFLRPLFDLFLVSRSGLPNPNTPATLLLIVIYSCAILFNKNDIKIVLGDPFVRKFNVIFMLLFSLAVVSSFNSPLPLGSVPDLARLLSLALIVNYTAVYISRSREGAGKLIKVLLASSIVPILFGLYQLVSGRGLRLEGVNRVFGSFVHPNVFAEYLFVVFFILMYRLSSRENKAGSNRRLITFSTVVLFMILNTFTRNVWIALFAACLLFFTFGKDVFKKIGFVFWIAAALVLVSPFLIPRFANVLGTDSRGYNSWDWRLNLWRRTIDRVYEHPIIGHGLGSFQQEVGVPAHNDYLRISYELGFAGLFIYLILIAMVMTSALGKAGDKTRPLSERKMALAIFCIFLGFLIISMADNLARSTVVLIYAFVPAAAYLSAQAERKNEDPARQ